MNIAYMESPFEELNRFRNYAPNGDNIEIPLSPENRVKTDRNYAIAFAIAVVILLPFLVYTLAYADFRNLGATDNCGNLCGYKNPVEPGWNCSGEDMTDKKFLVIARRTYGSYPELQQKTCMESCPQNNDYQFCINNIDEGDAVKFEEAVKDVVKGWWIIVLSVIISCLLCYGMILLFRYAVNVLVWSLIFGFLGLLVILAFGCWHYYIEYRDVSAVKAKNYMVLSMVFGGWALVGLIILTCMIERVKLIIALFKEAAKAIFEIPALTKLPLLTFTAVSLCLVAFSVLTTYLLTARKLVENISHQVNYEPDGIMIFTILYNLFVSVWVLQFLNGAQYIIIAGAVSAWFFTRNKQYLDRPVWTSFINFIKYHVGTVLIGSLIITIVIILRAILRAIASNRKTRWLVECCCNELIAFLKFFSKNAYIQTAMHGQPYFKSGKRAWNLIISNVENVIAINSLGDYVLIMAQFLLIVVGGAAGIFIAMASGNPQAVAIGVICCVINWLLVIIFFGIFEATIDSMFMCFCEDTLLNDGMARPFYMTKGLHQFVENCKGVLPAKK